MQPISLQEAATDNDSLRRYFARRVRVPSMREQWLAERARLGVPLSDEEILHGVRVGILPWTLLVGAN